MANNQFNGSKLRANLPRGGIKQLCNMFKLSDTWIRKILDGKVTGYPNILAKAKELAENHKAEKSREIKEYIKVVSQFDGAQHNRRADKPGVGHRAKGG